MGLWQGDVVIKAAIQLGLEDMRKNPWLIDHMLEDLVSNPYLADKYGKKQVDACKEWFRNNQIDIYMVGRTDKDRLPCITISMGPSPEKEDMKSMADQSTETTMLLPNQIGKPIGYVVKPFVPISYDPSVGAIGVEPGTKGLEGISAGMILVNPDNGVGYSILDVTSDSILIEPNMPLVATRLGVLPQFPFYSARIEHTFFQDSYQIGCHAHGDPQTTLWLHSIVLYSILRYRESLLESSGFTESKVSNSDLSDSDFYTGPGGEAAYSRFITLTGQVENSWIKSPRRTIESIVLKDPEVEPGATASLGYTGGIKILTNLDTPDFIDESEEGWITNEDDEV